MARQKTVAPSTLTNLPSEIQRSRILTSAQSAEFWGVSQAHWRLYRTGKVPHGILVGKRKLGWRVGELIDALDALAA